ncbi:hypothetical protein TcYC6_0040700 [Trypanosoma cruzi]|uniref:Uncharacterized protein n=2 Tax=Trypanosoma cruzi TaxID=5693 RepID=Q4DLY8_TRYCC|nr:hypothetical protein Tc00.1047053506753.30 [Trypanosoma cruzi]EAN93517.1 hypothetical protein Tc00.1047053506753.30 [Trypanosoma cruzi]KAF5217934.1 hypothetical protein ECC02_009175 [Trypanosoma cruzi]KAF8303982.1 hypothetical protein TcYC6_0040700 [Trypanosoma cruzi]|eukprot:XP_815368.1 hypothetical protein [Trypanosoma cruzi strain CL Brener]
MLLSFMKIPLVLLLWCASVLLCDVQSAAFVEKRGSVLEMVFFINIVGCLVPGGACLLCRSGGWRELWQAAILLYESATLWRLFFVVNFVNVLATYLMFSSFTFAGMTHVYAIKTTEPLVMCLLSTEIVQRVIRGFFADGRNTKSGSTDIDPYPMSTKIVSSSTWVSVFFVCIGASLTSGSLKRSGESSLGAAVIMFTYILVFASNAALSLRTTLMKPLLHIIPNDGTIFPSCLVHFFVLLLSSITLLGPVLAFRGRDIMEYNADIWRQIVVVGISYGVYQVFNGVVLFHVAPLSYSILKQVRVILVFFFSAYYFGKEFDSVLQLLMGLILLFAGSYCYVVY